MKEVTKERQSNFELMRIISMFLIVLDHVILKGGIYSNSTGALHVVVQFILFICIVHVNSFVLLTGYFQYNKRLRFNKIIAIINSMWFYKVICVIIFLNVGIVSISPIDKILSFLPISFNDYWFIDCYIILYLVSPILNVVIKNIDRSKFRKILFLLFAICIVLTTFTQERTFNNLGGYSITNFIFLYFWGAYLGKYGNDKNNICNKITVNCRRLLLIFGFFMLVFFKLAINSFGERIVDYGTIMSFLGNVINGAWLSYDSPLIFALSVIYFEIFRTFNFKNRIINKLSKYVFGIYLIHENPYIRQVLYSKIFKLTLVTSFGKGILLKILMIAIIIFASCMLIEAIRQLIFKFIYNRKWAEKFREWYQNRIKLLGVNINW